MMAIPPEERPYEKCLAYGASVLTDAELLAVILRTGSLNQSALTLARNVLKAGREEGLLGLIHTDMRELLRIRGIGTVKAVQLKCIAELAARISRAQAQTRLSFSEPSTVADYYMEELRHQEQEVLVLVMLDGRNQLLRDEMISKGSVHAAVITPREIFIPALRVRAAGIILLHNHPSGRPDPSKEDIRLTQRVYEAGMLMGVPLLDHIIIGDRKSYSMKEQGNMDAFSTGLRD